MTADIDEVTAASLFSNGGEMGDRLQKVNWSETWLGPVETWPQSLKTTVKLCVSAHLPMAVWWRNESHSHCESQLEVICNDAYLLSLGQLSFEPKSGFPNVSTKAIEIQPALESVLATGQTTRNEYQWETKSEFRYFEATCSPLFDDAGKVSGVFAAVTEKTAQKRIETIQDRMQAEARHCEAAIEKSAQKAQRQIRNVLESVSDAFIALDREWRYTYVNKKAAQLLHQKSESLIGQPVWDDAFPGKTGTLAYQELHRAMQENVPVVFEEHSPIFDAWFEVHGYPSAEGLAIYFQDVSDRKKAEAAREHRLAEEQAAREAAEAASRLKDEFLAVVSHELRSPLNPILGCAKLLKKGDLSSERKEQALESIERNAHIQAQLVNDLLDVSRILRNELSLSKCSVPVTSAIQTTLEKLNLEALNKDISIETHFSPQVSSVLADPTRLQQILWNLLSNAIKFTPRSGKVVVCTQRTSCHVKISITDTGIGINSSFLPHVFDRFRQEDAATTRQFGGLGLGLSIVQHLVDLHGGIVEASSPGADKGATFTLLLPVSPSLERVVKNGKLKQVLNSSPVEPTQLKTDETSITASTVSTTVSTQII